MHARHLMEPRDGQYLWCIIDQMVCKIHADPCLPQQCAACTVCSCQNTMDAERLQVGRQKIKLRERKELSWRLTKRMGGLTFKGIWTRWGDRTEVKGRLIQVTGISFIFLHCLVRFFSFTKLRDNFQKVILEPTTLIPPIWLGSRHLMKWSQLFFFPFFL